MKKLNVPAVSRVLMVVLAVGAACGESGPSREEFVREVNAMCKEHKQRIDQAASRVIVAGRPPNPRQFMTLANQTIIPEHSKQFEMLGEIEAPEDLADEYKTYVAQGKKAVEEMKRNPVSIIDASNFEDLNQKAHDLGFSHDCHVGPGQ